MKAEPRVQALDARVRVHEVEPATGARHPAASVRTDGRREVISAPCDRRSDHAARHRRESHVSPGGASPSGCDVVRVGDPDRRAQCLHMLQSPAQRPQLERLTPNVGV